jgi:anti-sigma factor RsiW
MSRTRDHYSDNQMQEFLNGELSEHENGQIRSHTETCAECRQLMRELVTVRELLRADAPAEPIRPMWPAVRERLEAAARPRFRLVFALGTSAAAIAGIILGLYLGSLGSRPTGIPPEGMWSDVPTTLTNNPSGGIADVFLAAPTQEGDVSK